MSDGPVVGVVGPDAEAVVAAVRAAGGKPRADVASAVVGDTDHVVAVGQPALLAVARARPDVSVLPVDAGRGVRSVPGEAVERAITELLAGDSRVERHPLVDVRAADRTTATVLCDALLVSAEPAQISEYTVHAGGERVAQFRADGVVVATPAGSSGYAGAAGGPTVAPGTGVAVVVPVAPFATDDHRWVVGLDSVRVTVERDETAVQLIADDRAVGPVDTTDTVDLSPSGSVPVAVVPASRSAFVD